MSEEMAPKFLADGRSEMFQAGLWLGLLATCVTKHMWLLAGFAVLMVVINVWYVYFTVRLDGQK